MNQQVWCLKSKAQFVAIGKARAKCAQSFTLWHQATIEITGHSDSISACSRHIYMGVVLRAYPVRGESHVQRKADEPFGCELLTLPSVAYIFLTEDGLRITRNVSK